jgi:hypothetical protein
VLAVDIAVPLAALAALVMIGIVLGWPLWWVSVCSIMGLLIVQSMVVNFVLARRDSVTLGTDDDGPGLRLAAVALTTAALVAAVLRELKESAGATVVVIDKDAENFRKSEQVVTFVESKEHLAKRAALEECLQDTQTSDRLLVEMARLHPERHTVLLMGPATVLAAALDREPALPKLLKALQGHDVVIILGMGRNRFVLKRNRDEAGTRIRIEKLKGIEDPHSLEYWINRRAVEFHIALHGPRTDVAWVDIDIHKPKNPSKDRARARSIVPRVAKVIRKVAGGSISRWDSGRTGFHVMSNLREEDNVNHLRRSLRSALDAEFKGADDVTTKIAKPGQIRLDVTTLKKTGSLRAPYSLSVFGRVKRPIGGAK